MTSRRDRQLQQLGITQWALRRPAALQGEIAISLPAHVRLVMVANSQPALSEPFIGDILRALKLTPYEVMQLTPDRVAMLPEGSRCNSWQLGVAEAIALNGSNLATPALDELKANPAALCALWQQICEHENNFFPHDD